MVFPSCEWENHQVFAWINRTINKMYCVNVGLNNKNTRTGRGNVTLYTDVPSPFHFIPGAYEKFGFDREIHTFDFSKNADLMKYTDDSITYKPKKKVWPLNYFRCHVLLFVC